MFFRTTLALTLAVAAIACATENDDSTKHRQIPPPLLGSWQDQGATQQVIHFEPAKCVLARLGSPDPPSMHRAAVVSDKIVTDTWGRIKTYKFDLNNQLLTLTELPNGIPRSYRKLAKVPPEVQVKPLPLGKFRALPAEEVRSIREELARRRKIDQEVRTDPTRRKEMARVDANNTKYLIKLVQDTGWIDVERFGAQTSHEAFLIVQHSGNTPLMLAALPPIEADVKAKRLDAQPYALLYDRLRIMLGEKQRYGTQLGSNEKGRPVLLPLQDRARVDELRKAIGLFPLAEYLKFFEQQNGGKPVQVLDDE
jgi:hypothetical protein